MGNKSVLVLSGLLSGMVFILSWILFHLFFWSDVEGADLGSGEALGYLSMIIALSTVYFGVRNYRDKQRGGVISFKEAFFNGMLIVLIGSAIYVISWMVYYTNYIPDFADVYMEKEIASIKEQGLSETDLQLKIEEMEAFNESYKNPVVMAGITFLEVFPVGLIIALLSAFLLKRS